MIIVVSYRENHERWFRGRYEGGWSSAFDVADCKDAEEAAGWIARRIREQPEADYVHLLLARWEDVVAFAGWSFTPAEGEESVQVPDEWPYWVDDAAYPDDVGQLVKDWEALKAAVKPLVAEKLGALAKAEREAAERRRQEEVRAMQAASAREREARERAEYERLKSKYEGEAGGD